MSIVSDTRGSGSRRPCRQIGMTARTRLLLAVLAVLACAPPASAGTYHVYSCRTPAGVTAPTDGWSAQNLLDGGVAGDSCAEGGPLYVALSGARSYPGTPNDGLQTTMRYELPDGLELERYEYWRSMRVQRIPGVDVHTGPITYIAYHHPLFHDDFEWCGEGCSALGTETSSIVPENHQISPQYDDLRVLYFGADCIGYNPCPVRSGDAARMLVAGFDATVRDEDAPDASDPSGPLAGAGPHRGFESVTFNAQDDGGGLYRTKIALRPAGMPEFEVATDVVVDDNDGRCAELDFRTDSDREFGFRRPCRLLVSETATLDTTQVPDGDYALRVTVEDAGGNTAKVYETAEFEIDNVPPPEATSPPTATGEAMEGEILIGNLGAWSGAGNAYSRRWLRCTSTAMDACAPIDGADADTYPLRQDDLGRWLRFEVTAANAEGRTTAASAPRGPVTNSAGHVPQCADGKDNDGDGKTDSDDPSCANRADDNEGVDSAPPAETTPVASPAPTPSPAAPPPSRGQANGTNASERARLTLSGPARLSLAFRAGAATTLALRDENGRAIAGASVAVLQRMSARGAAWVPAHAPLITDADGRVRYTIEPGYSRTLRFAYRAHAADRDFATAREIAVRVRSKTTLRTSRAFLRNGQTVRFLGRIVSRPVPSRGVVIDLQARVGRRWQTFESTRTTADGRWRARYRFRHTTGLQRYAFRARVRGDSGFPYAPSVSRRVGVHVRG